MSLLVLALAASIVTPVLSAEAAQPLGKNEERVRSHLVQRGYSPERNVRVKAFYAGLAAAGVIAAGLGAYGIYSKVEANKKSRDISRRKERSFGRGMPVDISEDRSFLDITRRTSSHLELLNRADLGEALSLFGRMLDELD